MVTGFWVSLGEMGSDVSEVLDLIPFISTVEAGDGCEARLDCSAMHEEVVV